MTEQKKSKKKSKNTSYEVVTNRDANGDILLPIPPALLKKLGWDEGDDIEFCAGADGEFILRKVN
jgi:bifunctional DNA-binding transcriptional regulator/antitoxin component of YhaV-PrlF toxin-antitoxin module